MLTEAPFVVRMLFTGWQQVSIFSRDAAVTSCCVYHDNNNNMQWRSSQRAFPTSQTMASQSPRLTILWLRTVSSVSELCSATASGLIKSVMAFMYSCSSVQCSWFLAFYQSNTSSSSSSQVKFIHRGHRVKVTGAKKCNGVSCLGSKFRVLWAETFIFGMQVDLQNI